ncbi:MAG: hypothetical protein SGCHY_002747 [Lobulomycetales sp.]
MDLFLLPSTMLGYAVSLRLDAFLPGCSTLALALLESSVCLEAARAVKLVPGVLALVLSVSYTARQVPLVAPVIENVVPLIQAEAAVGAETLSLLRLGAHVLVGLSLGSV